MSVKKNFIYNIIYQILIILLPLITTPYIARVIGAQGVGMQSYTYSIANYFVLFAMLGINNYGNRSIAMIRDNKEKLSITFMGIFSLKAIMTIIVMGIYIIYILIIDNEYKVLLLIQFIYIISAFVDINWFFFGMEQFKTTVFRNVIIKLLSVCSIFLFIKDSKDIYFYSLILALSNLISQLVLWRFIKKFVKFKKIKLKDIAIHIKPMIILFIPVVSVSIYKVMDKIMIGQMSSIIQVGYYENSEKIINIPISFIIALGTVMLPKISNLQSKGRVDQIERYISLSMDYTSFISIGAIFGIIGIAKIFIPIFLGNDFIDCILIVSLLAITIIFIAWANVIRTQYLIPQKKDKVYIKSTILGAIINITINIILIERLGAIGAAIGTIFAEASVCIYQTLKVRKELPVLKYLRRSIFYFIPGIIMYIIMNYISNTIGESLVSAIIQIIIGGVIYCIISLLYMIKVKNEVALNLLSKIKEWKIA